MVDTSSARDAVRQVVNCSTVHTALYFLVVDGTTCTIEYLQIYTPQHFSSNSLIVSRVCCDYGALRAITQQFLT